MSEGTATDGKSQTVGKTVFTPAEGTATDGTSLTVGKTVFTSAEGTEAEARISIANLTKLATNGTDLVTVGKTISLAEKTRMDIVEKTHLHLSDEENSNLIQTSPPHDKHESEGLVIIYGKPITDEKC